MLEGGVEGFSSGVSEYPSIIEGLFRLGAQKGRGEEGWHVQVQQLDTCTRLRRGGTDQQAKTLVGDMAQNHEEKERPKIPSCDAYFDEIQARKKLPYSLQESLTTAFSQISAASFPGVPGGKVIEILEDSTVAEAVKILSECNIMSAPVLKADAGTTTDWRGRYLGIIDYPAVILWVLECAALAAAALSTGSATAAGVGAGAVSALGAIALSATGPAAIVGLTVAAVGAAVAGGMAAEKVIAKDAPTAAGNLGNDFYNVILQEEPFKSTKVSSIVKSFRSTPFLPVSADSSMLTVLLLLSKYRLRNVPK
ncbi:hypothetical protein Nepgr_003532 [Nepenthes gracilis]|uniref:CBS domain-containing protein n=1 Tax=Nepenthes gracilis TaxID=150966 RepID=A0AAD3XDR4_NEPGR|nr:hypothetical protein Nepgr_003532 [Nepenthes gracilis]